MSKLPAAAIAGPVADLKEHKHCEVCGAAIALGGRVCSPECQARFEQALKMRKRSVWVFVGAIALILLFNLYGRQIFGP